MDFFKDKKILITGGTGTFGQALTERLLKLDVHSIRIFSRNEDKQVSMQEKFNDKRIRFFVGDIRDFSRLKISLNDVDIVFHTAALKHVDLIEYNPFEAIKTNIIGSQNVVNACAEQGVQLAVAISTDKAVSTVSTYGATKMITEKIFTTANNYLHGKNFTTKFLTVRCGNIFGSSGSVVPKFIEKINSSKQITVTDLNMTRFSMTAKQSVDFILESLLISNGSEIFVPKSKAYKLEDLRDVLIEIMPKFEEIKIPIRPGERLHEILISDEELKNTWELENKFVIFPTITHHISNPSRSDDDIGTLYPNIKKISHTTHISSEIVDRLTKNELKEMVLNLN
jgi:UDP-N-acetylglucosamine 4,6-dehydratase/UDP-glucose 4-epimerase